MAAISSLEILDSEDSLEYLKSIYQKDSLWHDRGMALKAIGDLDTKEGNAFLKEEKEKWSGGSSSEAKWNSMIIDLYLN